MKICLVQLLGLFAAGAPPSVHGFTLSVADRTRQSSIPCYLIRSTSSTSSNSGRNEIIPFFATRETSSPVRTESVPDSSSPSETLFDSKKPTTKSVYEKTPVSHHIKLTDYLRNPRSLQRTVTTTANITSTTITTTEPKGEPTSSIALSASSVLLEEAISTFNNGAAKRILAKLNEMRRANDGTVDQSAAIANFLDGLLERGSDQQQTTNNRLTRWMTQWRFMTRFSKRARLASLRRTLDLVTPPISASESSSSSSNKNSDQKDDDDDVESKKRRRRRAFVSLLNTLAKPLDDDDSEDNNSGKKQQKRTRPRHRGLPAIAMLEKKARREQQKGSSLPQDDDNLILRRPQNLETPNYTIVAKRQRHHQGGGGFEIRRYEPYSLCSVDMTTARPPDSYKTDAVISEPKIKGASSFGALAGYLFGKNQQETAMKMTTPVFTTLNNNNDDNNDTNDDDAASTAARRRGDEKMSFVLPSEFWKDGKALSLAPQPLDGSGVTLERIESGHRAVVMFGGYATRENVAQRKQELLQKIDKDPEWRVVVVATAAVSSSSNDANDSAASSGIVALAQYNDPFTPPWKRLNEISIAVERR